MDLDATTPYLVTEYVPGDTLLQRVELDGPATRPVPMPNSSTRPPAAKSAANQATSSTSGPAGNNSSYSAAQA